MGEAELDGGGGSRVGVMAGAAGVAGWRAPGGLSGPEILDPKKRTVPDGCAGQFGRGDPGSRSRCLGGKSSEVQRFQFRPSETQFQGAKKKLVSASPLDFRERTVYISWFFIITRNYVGGFDFCFGTRYYLRNSPAATRYEWRSQQNTPQSIIVLCPMTR